MKDKPEFLTINFDTWKKICQDTLFNIHSILESVQILLDKHIEENKQMNLEQPFVAAGLYTFAIEEYGKFLILSSITEQNGMFRIKYKDEFREHTKKFKKALENISDECILLNSGGFTNTGFTNTGFDTKVIADFNTRLGIFYSDFDDTQKVQVLPQVNSDLLSNAIIAFMRLVENKLEAFNQKYSGDENNE